MAKLKLTEDQKNLVRLWIAEGKKDCEIVRLAKAQNPPFEISQQNINKTYRRQFDQKITVLMEHATSEDSPLRTGLARKEERVKMLGEVAEDLLRRAKRVKGTLYPGYINQLRGCLDDIAKEMGQRREKIDLNANVQVKDITAIVERLFPEE